MQLSFDIGILTIFGRGMEEQCKEELKKNYYIVDKGYNSLPNRLPGTLYSKAVVVRQTWHLYLSPPTFSSSTIYIPLSVDSFHQRQGSGLARS